tara:strand:- start:610 stop:1173 length:564 start_codon:yes stop_codon:yes gene_type:complete
MTVKKEDVKKEDVKKAPAEVKKTPTKEVKKEVVQADPETVTMSKADFAALMGRIEKRDKDIELLYKAADKNRIQKAKGTEEEVLITTAKLSTWDDTGKIIVAWKMLSNRCEVVMGKWVEDQTVAIVFENGETDEVSYLEFVRRTLIKVTGDIVGRTTETDASGNTVNLVKLELSDGKKVEVNSSFVN